MSKEVKTVAARFWPKVQKTEGCWLWTAGTRPRFTYGWFATPSGSKPAHVVSWELAHGAVTGGLCVLHHCDNPKCVRPDHLFLGTRADNVADMIAKGRFKSANGLKTHCKRGHEYTPDNTMIQSSGSRNCRICFNALQVKYYRQKVAAKKEQACQS